MLNNIRTSIKLYVFLIVISVFILTIGLLGIKGMHEMNSNTISLYKDRVLALQQIKNIQQAYQEGILFTVKARKNNEITSKQADAIIISSELLIQNNWNAYLNTYLTNEENELVKITSIEKDELKSEIDKFKKTEIITNEFYDNFGKVSKSLKRLSELQISVSNEITLKNDQVFKTTELKFYLFILGSLIFVVILGVFLISDINKFILDLKLSNKKIKEAEEKCRTFIKYAGDAIVMMDQSFNIIEVSNSAVNLMGYTKEEILKLNFLNVIASDDPLDLLRKIENANENNFQLNEIKIIRKEGHFVDSEINIRGLENIGHIAIMRNVTERNQIQKHIRESEERYRYLFENNPACIIIWDLDNLTVLEVNKEVERKYGYSKEEFENMSIFQYRPNEDHDRIKDFAQKMLNGHEPISKMTWKHIKKNGEIMQMEISSHKIQYQGKHAILSLATDITDKLKATAALNENKAQLKLFIEHSPAALAMLDKNMHYLSTSKRWLTDYNLGDQEIIGKSHYEVFPETPQRWKEIHQKCLNGANEMCEEDAFVRANGSTEWLKWEIHPWYNEENEIGGIIILSEVITQRKKAIELFNHQFFNSPDTIFLIKEDFKIDTINHGQKDGFSALELVGKNCLNLFPLKVRDSVKNAISKCFDTCETQNFEIEMSKNQWVQARIVAINISGRIEYLMIILTDFSARKLAEETLKKSEERNRAILENINDCIVLIDDKLNVVYQSPSVERTVGYTMQDRNNKIILDFIHPEDLQICTNQYEQSRLNPGLPIQNQYRSKHKDGYYIWVEVFLMNLLHNKNVNAYVVLYRDISDRRKAEEQQMLMTSIVNSSNDAIISKTLDGVITSWNHGAEKILGYSEAEIVGKNISFIVPEDLKDEENIILQNIKEGNSVNHYITKRIRKDETKIDVSLTISPIRDSIGNIIGASKVIRDITEQKAAEEKIKRRNDKLYEIAFLQSHIVRKPIANILGIADAMDFENMSNPRNIILMNALKTSTLELDKVIHQIVQNTSEIDLLMEKK